MPTAVSDVFTDRLNEIIERAVPAADALLGLRGRPWDLPAADPDPDVWDGDPLNITGLAVPYSRTGPTTDYAAAVLGQARTGEAMAAKYQASYLGCMERAMRERHKTALRCRAHAVARRRGDGDSNGGPAGALSFAADLLQEANRG